VYFDEVHVVQSPSGTDTSYVNLMHAIKVIKGISIFFVFLSTNSNLQLLAPVKAQQPSAWVKDGTDLSQPFFELPFDTFSSRFLPETKAANKLTLLGVREPDQMFKFGRPMYVFSFSKKKSL
jgi:hypothetical protein